jgi:hypothetical protein
MGDTMKKILIGIIFLKFCLNAFSQEYVYYNLNAGKELVDITKYQNEEPEEIIFNVPNEIKNGIFTAPLHYLDQLIEFLTSWTDDNYLKIKSIHDWIVCNISYDVADYNKG